MADSVQAILDSMVAPLRDLLDRGIFSQSELRSVVERRRRCEYLLARRQARKSDFLRYIEDETKLERLRKLRAGRRRRRLAEEEREERERRRDARGRGDGDDDEEEEEKERLERERRRKPSIGDGHVTKHVHFIFTRALWKWREDVELHRAHAEFARSAGTWGRLGRIFAEALQAHPKDESLWIEAASHEFFGPPGSLESDPNYDPDDPTDPRNSNNAKNLGGNVRSARVLLQRGLRANPSSRALWHQHFCLELHYVQKLRGRREILRLGLKGVGTLSEDGDETGDGGGDGEGAVSDSVPLVVYRNAIKAVPDDAAFRLHFVDLSRQFPEMDRVRTEIVRTIERDFGDSVEAWVARARYAAEGISGEGNKISAGFLTSGKAGDGGVAEGGDGTSTKKRNRAQDDADSNDSEEEEREEDPVGAVLLEAVRRIPTSEMYLEAINTVLDRLRSRGGEDADDGEGIGDDEDEDVDSEAGRRDAALLGRLFDGASNAGVLEGGGKCSTDLVLARADYLLATGDARGAAGSLRSACVGDGNNNGKVESATTARADVWLRWADLLGRLEEAAAPLTGKEEGPGAEGVLRLAMERIPVRDPGHARVASALLRRLLLSPPPSFLALGNSGGAKATSAAERRRRDDEASELLGRVLLLAARSGGGGSGAGGAPADETSPRVDTPAELCLARLRSASLRGGLCAARRVYDPILFRSGYVKSCAGMGDDEVRSVSAFFEACLCAERAALAAEKAGAKKDEDSRRRVGCIYDAAIMFFREGGNTEGANHYRHRKGVDRALLK